MFNGLGMQAYECDSLTGVCVGGFGGAGVTLSANPVPIPTGGYAFAVSNVPYFQGTSYGTQEPVLPATIDRAQEIPFSQLLTGATPQQSTQMIAALDQAQPKAQTGIPAELLLIGGGLLALILLLK